MVEKDPQTVLSHILGKRLALHHLKDGFQTSIDSILLAAACPVQEGQTILDLGCGVGSAGLSTLQRVPNCSLTGVDIQKAVINLAQQNANENALSEQCQFIEIDIRNFDKENSFDHVILNPPYLESGTHLRSPVETKAISMGHEEATLEEWIKCAHRALKSKGSMTIIHRADHLDKIIQHLGRRFGSTEIIPLYSKTEKDANRVIVRTIKNRKSPSSIKAPIILHQEDGDYTIEANQILRDMKGLYL